MLIQSFLHISLKPVFGFRSILLIKQETRKLNKQDWEENINGDNETGPAFCAMHAGML